ncbi:MAG: sulfotransferase [Chloroflexota bacterium]
MLVDFMVIGAQKSGTTSLANQLADHPSICFCKEKEPGYFHQVSDWRATIDSYHSLYSPEAGQLCGEASTFYTFLPEWPDTHQRLFEYNPDLKLIYIMRHPVERVLSHYTHNLVRDLDTLPSDKAVFASPEYVNRSRYGVQIRPYLELFEREQVLLLIFEEYVRDQVGTLSQIAEFLGIDSAPFTQADTEARHKSVGEPYLKYDSVRSFVKTPAFQRLRSAVPESIRQPIRHKLFSNTLETKPELTAETRKLLWRLLEDDVLTIEKLLDRRLDLWRQGYTD